MPLPGRQALLWAASLSVAKRLTGGRQALLGVVFWIVDRVLGTAALARPVFDRFRSAENVRQARAAPARPTHTVVVHKPKTVSKKTR